MGKVIMSGVVPKLVAPVAPVKSIEASALAVGSSVYLNENGSPVEYIVVNQGIPENWSGYDSSCNGTWLLRKDIHSEQIWSTGTNNYNNSSIKTYLNGTFLGMFDSDTQSAIQQVKIPYYYSYVIDNSVISCNGSNGSVAKLFLLGYEEIYGDATYGNAKDGGMLTYFLEGSSESARAKRVAYLNGIADTWWIRSPHTFHSNSSGYHVTDHGYMQGSASYSSSNKHGVRPALVMPFNALFDEETLLFMGVE